MDEQLLTLLEEYDGEFLTEFDAVEPNIDADREQHSWPIKNHNDHSITSYLSVASSDRMLTHTESEYVQTNSGSSKVQHRRVNRDTDQRRSSSSSTSTNFTETEWKLPAAQVRSNDEPTLNPLEVMRKKNRENLRRARKLERDKIEQMKKTLQMLLDQYEQLRIHTSHRKNGYMTSETSRQMLEMEYCQVADLSHRLREKRFTLAQMLAIKQKWSLRIQQVVADWSYPTIPVDHFLQFEFEYAPITEEVARQRIWRSIEYMRWLEQTAQPLSTAELGGAPGKSGTHSASVPTSHISEGPLSCSSTFGWEVLCKVTAPNALFSCISKSFHGVQVQDVLDKMWLNYTKPKIRNYLLRHEILHVFNDTTIVSGVLLKHPIVEGKFIRSVDLCFRLATETGFGLGLTSMKCISPYPSSNEQSQNEPINWTSWFEFIPEKAIDTGLEGFRLKFYAHSIHKTPETMYTRLLNILQAGLKWENELISSSWKLLP